jgi:hypothetical protein
VNTKSRALAEVESDMQKTFTRLRGCLDALEPDSDTWLYVMRLCERLIDESAGLITRRCHYCRTGEGAACNCV